MIPERFVLVATGTRSRANSRAIIVPGALRRYFEAAILGQHVDPETWAAFGLRVYVEEDTDQGED